jgi:serine phosphatase RsbU (regulator of sigma subunit)
LTDPTTGLGRLPSDIEGFYRQDTESAIVEIEFRDMLGVLAVTRRPLRSHDIAAITGHPQRVIKERCLKPLRHLLREIDEGFSFYHRHFHEFVTREVLYIDELREYHGKIASWLSSKPSPSRDAFLESLAHHLSEAGHPEELASRITGDFLKEKIARFGYAVLEDIELVARALLSIDPSEAVDRCVALVDAVAAGSERFAHDAADTIRFGQAASRDRQMVAPQVPSAGGIDVFAALVPKSAASADFVEVVALGNRLAIAIGDAPGSGLRSAFVARFVATMFREALARGGAEDLSTTLRSIDTALRPHGHFAHVSLLAAVIDPTAGVVTLANAGHPFALRYSSRSDMSDRLLVRGDILNDTVREPVEPWFDTRRYELAAGDILVMVSDGLTEGGRLDDAYGYRFERLLREQRPTTAKDTATSILNDWTIHPRDPDTRDDATIVVAMLPQAKG